MESSIEAIDRFTALADDDNEVIVSRPQNAYYNSLFRCRKMRYPVESDFGPSHVSNCPSYSQLYSKEQFLCVLIKSFISQSVWF